MSLFTARASWSGAGRRPVGWAVSSSCGQSLTAAWMKLLMLAKPRTSVMGREDRCGDFR